MEKLKADLAAARTKLDAQDEPARVVARLESELHQKQIEEAAAVNLAAVKSARAELRQALEEHAAAKATMLEACRVALACWNDLRPLAQKIVRLRGPAMAEGTPIPNVPCPIDPATITRLS